MITEITIQNYRSIWEATVELKPFTLLIGANGAGKSNFLRLLKDVAEPDTGRLLRTGHSTVEHLFKQSKSAHINHLDESQKALIKFDHSLTRNPTVQLYSIDPAAIGRAESTTLNPIVKIDGSGAVQVLDSLKTGDREDLFHKIESALIRYVPEVEKLSFISLENAKQLQIRERYVDKPLPLDELSEGTRLVLTILTILYQENPPDIICLEDIDRGVHPRLFQKVVELCFDMTRDSKRQIIATTHNPFFVDQFTGHEDYVLIVEKKKGETQFSTLYDRMEGLGVEEDDPLGSLWYSGFVGGVPERRRLVR